MADEKDLHSFLSQDEIDAALNQAKQEASGGGEASPPEQGAEPGQESGLSQADVDAASGGGGEKPAEEDGGLLNQSDIDAALGGGGDAGGGVLSQDDINAALEGAAETQGSQQDTRVDSAGKPFDDIAAAMAEAIQSDGSESSPAGPSGNAQPADMPDFASMAARMADLPDGDINLIEDVELDVKIELGRSRMLVEDVLKLNDGAVVELDKLAGDPVDVLVNDRLVARGEVLVLNDNFCVRINEIVSQGGEAIRS